LRAVSTKSLASLQQCNDVEIDNNIFQKEFNAFLENKGCFNIAILKKFKYLMIIIIFFKVLRKHY